MMQIDAHVVTDRGRLKENNEDAGGSFFENRLLVVADGMGGGAAGEYASRQAVDQIREAVGQAKFYEDGVGLRPEGPGRSIGPKGLEGAVLHANTFLYSMAKTQENLRGMGTTAVCCLLEEGYAIFANIGDSRGYIYRDGRLRQVTKDHSLFSDPKAEKTNMITRALGQKSYAEIDTFVEGLEDGDLIFLCTDGLDKVVPDEIVERELGRRERSLRETAEHLVALANEGGGPDNITVLCARVTGVERSRTAPQGRQQGSSGVWKEDDALNSTVVTAISSGDTAASTISGVRKPPPQAGSSSGDAVSAKRGRSLLPWVLLSAALLLLAGGVVVWKMFISPPGRAPKMLDLELRRMAGEVAPAGEIIVERRGREIWKAEIAPSASEEWRVRTLVPDRGEWKTASLDTGIQLALPADVGIADTIRIGVRQGEGSPVGAGDPIKLGSVWRGETGSFHLLVPTRKYEDVRREAWREVLEEGVNAGQKVLTRGGFDNLPPSVLEEELAWLKKVEKARKSLVETAGAMDELLENRKGLSTEEFRRQDEALQSAVARMNRLAPPATESVVKDPAAFLSDPERYRLLKSKLDELDEQRDRLLKLVRKVDSASAEELKGKASAFQELLDNLGLQADPVELRALKTLEEKPELQDGVPTPRPTRTPRKKPTPKPVRQPQYDTKLADLRARIEQLKPDLVGDPGKRLTSGLIAELNGLRGRLEALFREIMKGKMDSRTKAALVETSDAWAVLEFGISRGISCCEAKPEKSTLEMLRQGMEMGGNKLRQFRMAAKRYGECP